MPLSFSRHRLPPRCPYPRYLHPLPFLAPLSLIGNIDKNQADFCRFRRGPEWRDRFGGAKVAAGSAWGDAFREAPAGVFGVDVLQYQTNDTDVPSVAAGASRHAIERPSFPEIASGTSGQPAPAGRGL